MSKPVFLNRVSLLEKYEQGNFDMLQLNEAYLELNAILLPNNGAQLQAS